MITIEQMNFDSKAEFYKSLLLHPDVKRTFPMIFHPLFQSSIIGISPISEEATQKGLIMNLRPFGEFLAYGLLETAVLVFTDFRRQGIGKSTISLLSTDRTPRFFVSSASNKASSAFFSRQPELVLAHENERYKVYKNALPCNFCS
jgi:hypothetical protein